jgi:metal-responsive CopG/Arc/MetJ family transcriptional regulator
VNVFGSNKVKLDDALLAKIRKYAGLAGYSSADEFITHALEKEIARIEEGQSEDEIKKRLKGLGYIS